MADSFVVNAQVQHDGRGCISLCRQGLLHSTRCVLFCTPSELLCGMSVLHFRIQLCCGECYVAMHVPEAREELLRRRLVQATTCVKLTQEQDGTIAPTAFVLPPAITGNLGRRSRIWLHPHAGFHVQERLRYAKKLRNGGRVTLFRFRVPARKIQIPGVDPRPDSVFPQCACEVYYFQDILRGIPGRSREHGRAVVTLWNALEGLCAFRSLGIYGLGF